MVKKYELTYQLHSATLHTDILHNENQEIAMKRKSIITAIILVLVCFLAITPPKVQAKSDPTTGTNNIPGIAEGSWIVLEGTGTEFDVTSDANSAPVWLQLLGKGIKLREAKTICHPFRGGQFGRVGEIRKLEDGKWVKLPTVNKWEPNAEGVFMSCADAPGEGTYALFGYFEQP